MRIAKAIPLSPAELVVACAMQSPHFQCGNEDFLSIGKVRCVI